MRLSWKRRGIQEALSLTVALLAGVREHQAGPTASVGQRTGDTHEHLSEAGAARGGAGAPIPPTDRCLAMQPQDEAPCGPANCRVGPLSQEDPWSHLLAGGHISRLGCHDEMI